MIRQTILPLMLLTAMTLPSQMPIAGNGVAIQKADPVASTELLLTGIAGKSITITPAELKTMQHISVSVHNAHTNKDESYSGVQVKDLLALVEPTMGAGPKVSANMQIVVATATDGFHVALTLCDTNPVCRSGQALVADTLERAPLTKDGVFKLILTEDKKPARWARNLQSLTVQAVPSN